MSDWQVDFQWDEDDLTHAARHGITPRLVRDVAANDPVLLPHESEGRSGSHLMIGPNPEGNFGRLSYSKYCLTTASHHGLGKVLMQK